MHATDRNQISREHRTVAQLDGIVRSAAKFIANAASRSIAGCYFQREFPRIETLFTEFKDVLADAHLYNFRCCSHFLPVDSQQRALWNGVYRRGHRARSRCGQGQGSWISRCRERDLKLYCLPATDVAESYVALADSGLILVEGVKRETCAPDHFVGKIFGSRVRKVCALLTHAANLFKFGESEAQDGLSGFRPREDFEWHVLRGQRRNGNCDEE